VIVPPLFPTSTLNKQRGSSPASTAHCRVRAKVRPLPAMTDLFINRELGNFCYHLSFLTEPQATESVDPYSSATPDNEICDIFLSLYNRLKLKKKYCTESTQYFTKSVYMEKCCNTLHIQLTTEDFILCMLHIRPLYYNIQDTQRMHFDKMFYYALLITNMFSSY